VRITALETFAVPPRWLFLKLSTDDGLAGWGEVALAVPAGPGLGIELDEARVREAARGGHRWRNPVWRYGDGTLAEW
jgi:galactonate dehydratase